MPAKYPLIFLFTGETGTRYGYNDKFNLDGTFWYTGEGQKGDMEMVRGNRAIREHKQDGKEIHLFETVGKGDVRYVGRATYLDHHFEDRRDRDDRLRKAIVFELLIETELVESLTFRVDEDKSKYHTSRSFKTKSLQELRELALTQVLPTATKKEQRVNVYIRSEAIREYVLRRAEGICEGCDTKAPFINKKGKPYLEPHHLRRLSDGGPDHPEWVIALCPNCHRRVHFGKDGEEYNAQLILKLGQIETHDFD